MRTCMATVSLGGGLEDKLDGIAAAGFDSIELLDGDLDNSTMSPRDVADRCRDLGLAIDLYQPFRRAEGVAEQEFGDVLSRFRRELDVMAELGADSILVVSNTDADAEASRDLSAEQLSTLGDAAAERGMTVQFEALAWGTHIGTVADAWDTVQKADHPGIFLVVDTFHMIARDEDAAALTDIPVDRIGFFQLADAPPRLSLDLIQWSRNHRCFPGDGEFDLLTPTAALIGAGYQGPISLEIFNPRLRERSPHDVSAEGAASLRALIGELGTPTARSEAS